MRLPHRRKGNVRPPVRRAGRDGTGCPPACAYHSRRGRVPGADRRVCCVALRRQEALFRGLLRRLLCRGFLRGCLLCRCLLCFALLCSHLMPPLGRTGLSAIPRVCCKTYIATYCDVSTKKVRVPVRALARIPATDHAKILWVPPVQCGAGVTEQPSSSLTPLQKQTRRIRKNRGTSDT